MLLSFAVGNYLSFKEVQRLDLSPDALKEFPENLHTPFHYNSEDRILKSVAIYGHNSHGKSNFMRSFAFIQDLIFNSFTKGQSEKSIANDPFAFDLSMHDKATFFEIVFLIKQTKYRYQVNLTTTHVISEILYYAESKIRENQLFIRAGQEIRTSKQWNKESGNNAEKATIFVKPHILFLSVLFAQEKITRIGEINIWLSSNIIVPDNYLAELLKARLIYSDSKYRSLILKFIEAADLGFTSIFDKLQHFTNVNPILEKDILEALYKKEIRDFELYSIHKVYDSNKIEVDKIEFELLRKESAGSIKYFVIVCLLAAAIKNSQIIWIDELDARFHSDLLAMLITSFHDPKINPVNAQLIFTTHNTLLLDKNLRRDQMVVIEKDEWGESTLRRVHSSETPIRIGKSLEKEYRKGVLGGVSKTLNRKGSAGPTLFD